MVVSFDGLVWMDGWTEGFPSFMTVLLQKVLTAIKAIESLQLVTFILFIFLWTCFLLSMCCGQSQMVRWEGKIIRYRTDYTDYFYLIEIL